PGIREHIYQHGVDVNRILHRIDHAGGTFSADKMYLGMPEVNLLGSCCTNYGRRADDSHVIKIRDWP
ncbi:hypothetical protein SISSUDRAFT_964152, partial [Sistotremastrum suecicum HHB10207 ss-3]